MIFEMFREIEIQIEQYKRHNNGKQPLLIVNPKWVFGQNVRIYPNKKTKLFNSEVEVSQSIKVNEFIIGEKFEVEVQE